MSADGSAVALDIGHRQQGGNSVDLPSARCRELRCQSLLHAERSEQSLEIGNLRLDLDDQERSGVRMKGHEVDSASLAVHAEARLRLDDPSFGCQCGTDVLNDCRMLIVEKSSSLATPSGDLDLNPQAQRIAVLLDDPEPIP